MTEQHDQDEEVMRAKLFASMKKKTPNAADAKKPAGPADAKPNSADNIVIKSFDQIMREKKANDNAGSSDDQGIKEKGLNRKRATDLRNRQLELALARKQAKVAAGIQATSNGEAITNAITRAKRAGQPLGIRSRLEKPLSPSKQPEPTPAKPASTSPTNASSQVKSPVAQALPSPKSLPNEAPLNISEQPIASASEEAESPSIAPAQSFLQQFEALKREIDLANKIIDEFAQMNVPEFRDLHLDVNQDDDQKFIENMSSFLAGTVS